MFYVESTSTDPYWNLALEQFVFDRLGPQADCFMLWQNDKTIVVGKYQNVLEEINSSYVKEHGITVARRLSGGGAVYHDMGNLNFTFVAEDRQGGLFDFSVFCRPVVEVLQKMGVPAQINGRNDMTIEGRKFSGNAQYLRQGRVMHHGTLMFDSDLEAVGQALSVRPDKILSKGFKSVRSRVTNIKPYVKTPVLTTGDFWDILRQHMFRTFSLEGYCLSEEDTAEVKQLREEIYSRWEWNFGHSPNCRIRKERRVEGCGSIQVYMDVEHGEITQIAFRGDYFSSKDSDALSEHLKGTPLEEKALRQALEDWRIEDYFARMDLDTFLSVLLQ